MDVLRAVQLLTEAAYLLLGIAAVAAAVRSHERVRFDVAFLFGTLAVSVVLQEIPVLACASQAGCLNGPAATLLATALVLLLPYALLRLIDDIADVPNWRMVLALAAAAVLTVVTVASGPSPAGWVVTVLIAYLVLGTCYATWAFIERARRTTGMTRRRMAAVAWGCGLLAATFVLTLVAQVDVPSLAALMLLARIASLISGLCFWAGFFPPAWLSQAWRSPELVEYLRPGRLMAAPTDRGGVVTDALALDRLTAATARTTGARRAFLILEDPVRQDLYLWGAPSARMEASTGLFSQVLRTGKPLAVRSLTAAQVPACMQAIFASEPLPRTALLVPICYGARYAAVLAAFADKGPMFVEDDLEVVGFFAGEAGAVLQMQRLRESANELEALREADRLKDEFMAVVSHELRTPLTAITGYADILLRRLSGDLNDRQQRQVVGIRDASRRLLALINDLLDVSKLEAGTLDLHPVALDPWAAIARAVAGVRVIAGGKGVTIVTEEPRAGLPPVRADDERLQQILTNLLVNAIKFTPQGGQIWVGAAAEPSQQVAGGIDVLFRVRDTGVGLRPGQAERIWDRFYQVESSSTRRFGGAGLGLSIVRRLAELHGGRAEAESAGVDRGSTFSVRLPVVEAGAQVPAQPGAAAATAATAEEPPAAPSATPDAPLVLVVEDDPHIATVMRTYLEAEGYRVDVATDGHMAIQSARTLEPFAITLDISLPKLDGWSVLNVLKREPATAHVPVVIVSIVDNREFGLVLGATDYLVKPIDPERLQAVLRGLRPARVDGDGSILVVDDDPSLRDVLGSMLAEDGWRVATAGDGEAALEAIERERPTAIVLDLMMPRVDGFDVLSAVRQRPATRDLPIIVVTAKDLTDDDRQRLAECAQRVVVKQALRVDELRQEIRALLRSHRARVDYQSPAGGAHD